MYESALSVPASFRFRHSESQLQRELHLPRCVSIGDANWIAGRAVLGGIVAKSNLLGGWIPEIARYRSAILDQ